MTHITTIFEAILEDRQGEQSLPLPNMLPWDINEWNCELGLSVSKGQRTMGDMGEALKTKQKLPFVEIHL